VNPLLLGRVVAGSVIRVDGRSDLAGTIASRPAAGGLRGIEGGECAEKLGEQRAEAALAPGEVGLVGHRLALEPDHLDAGGHGRGVGRKLGPPRSVAPSSWHSMTRRLGYSAT
jgi:hypothetical protein